jgi:hypothetical protein
MGHSLMSRQASFAIGFVLALFPLFCCGEQPVPGSDAAMSGLYGRVHTVLTETFIYEGNGQKTRGVSEVAIYDRAGYETELYEYSRGGLCSHGLCSHTVYARFAGRLVKAETTNLFSKQKSVELYNSDGFVIETDTYDSNGMLAAKTPNVASVKADRRSLSTTRKADGSISTVERFWNGSFKECTVKADGTTVIHFHSSSVDWRQVTDSNNRSLDYIEEPSTGKYLRISSHYGKGERESETDRYDRPGKLVAVTIFQYPHEDRNGNWTEQQIWVKSDGKAAQLVQVTRRTIAYY